MGIQINKVLISDEVDDKCIKILQTNGIAVTKNTKLSKEELIKAIPEFDGLIVRSATKVTADVINAGINLKIIGRAGTGVDNIDAEAATKNGVIVMNTPGGNTLSAAEHTCTLLIALSRNLGAASLSMKEGKWDRKKFMGAELFGKTLGIVGLGRIGKEVALRMQSFGMRTIGFDPIVKPEESAEWNTLSMSLEDLWPQCDYITFHTPLIPQTKHLLNDNIFAKCKKGVRVVNCARGGIIDEAALLRALESGQCAAAGLDVFEQEPPKDYTLAKHPNVVATPHLGASTLEAQTRVAEDIAQQFVDVAQGKSLFGAINAHALQHALSKESQPWVQLGERIGVVASLLTKTLSLFNVDVLTQGSCLKNAGNYLAASVMVGYLRTTRQESGDVLTCPLNIINAPTFSRQANIGTNSSHKGDGDVPSVTVCFQGCGGEIFNIQGTVAGSATLLMSVEDHKFNVPAVLEGNAVVYQTQKDYALADLLGAAARDGVNVQAVSTSAMKSNLAYGVINASGPVTGKLDNINSVVTHAYPCSL